MSKPKKSLERIEGEKLIDALTMKIVLYYGLAYFITVRSRKKLLRDVPCAILLTGRGAVSSLAP